jgi:hypothetical protein
MAGHSRYLLYLPIKLRDLICLRIQFSSESVGVFPEMTECPILTVLLLLDHTFILKMTRCMASFLFPWTQVHWMLRLTPFTQDLDKHLGDLYPSIIGMFFGRNDE